MDVSRRGVIALWLFVLTIFLAVRIVLGGVIGEVICTVALIVATFIRFSFGCFGTNNANRIQNEITGNDSAPNHQVDETEPIDGSSDTYCELTDLIDEEASGNEDNDDGEEQLVVSEPETSVDRFVYLDNVKIFLTMLVVTHHTNCAFGGCGRGSWFLIVGVNGPPAFERFMQTSTMLNQAFFMPLFFFISAYFVPSSFVKRGGWNRFRQGKKKRILIPALVETFVITPVCIAIAASVTGADSIKYIPHPGVAWFLFWLLLFNWMYVTLIDETSFSEERIKQNFPSTLQRILSGAGVCGLLLLPLLILVPGSFAAMPISIGSFTCDFFMFYLGIQARNHGWLETSTTTYLYNQLDIHPILFFVMVIAEGTGLTLLMPLALQQSWAGFLLIVLSGMFCLDMSLLVLVFFQGYVNFETWVSKVLARAAYGVYLLHPFVVTSLTALYIFVYNKLPNISDPISFDDENGQVGSGGEDHFGVGWVLVLLASHVIVWPLAYGLTRIPFLKSIL
jgi:glucan biosynthesis protein C